MSEAVPVITVDGPGGTGKGTLCCYLANWLGWHLLDSGALYRVLAFSAVQQGIPIENEKELADQAQRLNVNFKISANHEGIDVWLDDHDVSQLIRSEECGKNASQLAAYGSVRQALLSRQRKFRQSPGLVADGRDMGTVVFKDAELKIYLTASPEERALRRHKQLKQKGFSVNLAQLSADIAERDTRDSQRTISPLRPAQDAVVINTTNLSIESVNERIRDLVRERMPDLV